MTAARAFAYLQRMQSRPIRNGLAHLGSASLCSVQQPACAMRRTVCRLRAVTAAVTYVTQPISGSHRSPVEFCVMRAGTGSHFSVLSGPHYNSFQCWFSAPIRIFSVLTEVSGREKHADISLISPKITGVVLSPSAVLAGSIQWAFMAGVGRQGRERLCCVGREREKERERQRDRERQTDRQTGSRRWRK